MQRSDDTDPTKLMKVQTVLKAAFATRHPNDWIKLTSIVAARSSGVDEAAAAWSLDMISFSESSGEQ
jgi:hypothetical protein